MRAARPLDCWHHSRSQTSFQMQTLKRARRLVPACNIEVNQRKIMNNAAILAGRDTWSRTDDCRAWIAVQSGICLFLETQVRVNQWTPVVKPKHLPLGLAPENEAEFQDMPFAALVCCADHEDLLCFWHMSASCFLLATIVYSVINTFILRSTPFNIAPLVYSVLNKHVDLTYTFQHSTESTPPVLEVQEQTERLFPACNDCLFRDNKHVHLT